MCIRDSHEAAIEVVNKIFGEEMFHKVQGQTQSIPRKPSPVGALAIAEAFDVKPEECLYCGDTNTDMDTGKAAGMYTIGVTWGFRPRQELVEHHADKMCIRDSQIAVENSYRAGQRRQKLTQGILKIRIKKDNTVHIPVF